MTDNHSTDNACTNAARSGTYRIFLLTCWLEDDEDLRNSESWRFRLEEPRTGVLRGCVGAKRFVALLCEHCGAKVDDVEESQ